MERFLTKKEYKTHSSQIEQLIDLHKRYTRQLTFYKENTWDYDPFESNSREFDYARYLNKSNANILKQNLKSKTKHLSELLFSMGVDIENKTHGEKSTINSYTYTINKTRQKQYQKSKKEEEFKNTLTQDGFFKKDILNKEWAITESLLFSEFQRSTSEMFNQENQLIKSFREFEESNLTDLISGNYDKYEHYKYDRIIFIHNISFAHFQKLTQELYDKYLTNFPLGNITMFLNKEFIWLIDKCHELTQNNIKLQYWDSHLGYDYYLIKNKGWGYYSSGNFIAFEKREGLDIEDCKHYYITYLNKLNEFLIDYTTGKNTNKIQWDIETDTNYSNASNSNTSKLHWSGEYRELTELLKALIETKKFVGHSDKEVFEKFCDFLGLDNSNDRKKDTLKTIRLRKHDKTKFLDELIINLNKWQEDKYN